MVKTCASCQGQFETEDQSKIVCPSCEAAQNTGSPQVNIGEASVTATPQNQQPAVEPTVFPETPAAPLTPEESTVTETPTVTTPPTTEMPESPVQQPSPTGEVSPQDQNPQG